jgi:dTDP-4-dehydrorhamnose reductase
MKILVLGISGMLGSMALRKLSADRSFAVYGTARSTDVRRHFAGELSDKIILGVDVEQADSLTTVLRTVRPDVVINCVGVVKQLGTAKDPLVAIPINSLLPHRLARLCDLIGARFIHISTDCVFSGRQGNYKETDYPDAEDLYGRSKLLGEVDYPNAITLRTSIIGRELNSRNGLVEWFLSQSGRVKGYSRAVFSGLTTDELIKVIVERVLPRPRLHGLYQVSSSPIDKKSLLEIIREEYNHPAEIISDDTVVIDRSLDSSRFRAEVGYQAPQWPDLIRQMHEVETQRSGLMQDVH